MNKSLLHIFAAVMLFCCAVQPASLSAAEAGAQEWRMRSGESLSDLAALIYPKDRAMQQRFVSATLALNAEQLAGHSADQPFAQGASIRIPDLRALSMRSGGMAPMARRPSHSAVAVAQRDNGGAMSQEEFERLNERLLQAAHAKSGDMQKAPEDESPAGASAPLKRVMAPTLDTSGDYAPGWLLAGLAAALLLAGTAYLWLRGRRSQRGWASRSQRPAVQLEPQEVVTPPEPAIVAEPPKIMPVPARSPGIAVEQIDSIVDEARVIVALGRTGNAIRLLNDHIDMHPHASVSAWLYLLELYRATGNQRAFTDLGQRMHTTFNVMVPAWEASKSALILPQSLEEFPHVMQRIIDGWGTTGCRDYLRNLLQDNREGERTGFSVEVFQEISLLLGVLEHREQR